MNEAEFKLQELLKTFFKLFSKTQWGLIGLVFVAYFVTRVINLDQFPIFSDEGIYIHWSKVAWHDASQRFISITDGRQPLQTWGTIPFLKIFSPNLLLGGRMFSVATGLVALIGSMTLSYYLFGGAVAIVSGFLYVLTPYFLFYDRMALVDSAVNASTLWIFLLAIILSTKRRLDTALILGLVAGMALLAKSSMRLYLALGLAAGVFLYVEHAKCYIFSVITSLKKFITKDRDKEIVSKVINFCFLYGLACAIAIVIYNIQRLSPYFHYVAMKNATFVLSISEFVSDPLAYFRYNITNIPLYIMWEMGWIPFFLGVFGLYKLQKNGHTALSAYFFIWLAVPWLVLSMFARVLFPRYVLSLGGLLSVLAAYSLIQLYKEQRRFTIGLVVVMLMIFSYAHYTILFAPAKVPFPQIDRGQYLEGWPAGWGMKEIVEFSRAESANKPVMLVAEGNFGMSGDVLDTFLHPGDKISIHGYWPLDLPKLIEHQKDLATHKVYVVFSHRRDFPGDWPIKLVKEYDKPGDESEIYLFELLQP